MMPPLRQLPVERMLMPGDSLRHWSESGLMYAGQRAGLSGLRGK